MLIAGTFLFSITPKQALHFIAAGHTDQSSHTTKPGDQLHVAAFHCNCNHVVATSPFIASATFISFVEAPARGFKGYRHADCVYRENKLTFLRGPPIDI